MPFIRVETNVAVDESRRVEIAQALSRLAADLLGKPESYVLSIFEPGKSLCFGGTTESAAFVELKSIGLPEASTAGFSREISTFLETALVIPADRVYIAFADLQRHMLGWDGKTF